MPPVFCVRFPDDFMFQLTKEELDSLRSQFVTANPAGHHNNEEWRSRFVTSNFARMDLCAITKMQTTPETILDLLKR